MRMRCESVPDRETSGRQQYRHSKLLWKCLKGASARLTHVSAIPANNGAFKSASNRRMCTTVQAILWARVVPQRLQLRGRGSQVAGSLLPLPVACRAARGGGCRLIRRVVVRGHCGPVKRLAARKRWVRTRGQQQRHGGQVAVEPQRHQRGPSGTEGWGWRERGERGVED